MGNMDTQVRLVADNANFDGSWEKSAAIANATASATEKAAKRAKDAQAFAAKFASDAVSDSSLKIVRALKAQSLAQEDYSRAQKIARSGYLEESVATDVVAAAMLRLAAAKKIVAETSATPKSGMDVGSMLMGAGQALALGELANKLREVITSSLEFGETISRMSKKTGLAVGTLSVLHYAAGVTGGDFEGMTKAVAKMDKTIGAATEGNKTAEAFMRSLGLNAKDLAGRTDGAEIAFKTFASTLAATENPIRRVELATGLLRKGGADQIPTIIQLGNNWDAFRQKASDAGVLLDGTTAAQLEATNQRLADMKQKLMGAGLQITEGFIPAFNNLLNIIQQGGSKSLFTSLGEGLAGTLSVATSLAYGLAAGFLKAAEAASYLTHDVVGAMQFSKMADSYDQKSRDAMFLATHGYERYAENHKVDGPKPFMSGGDGAGGDGFGGTGGDPGAASKAATDLFHKMEEDRAKEEQLGATDETKRGLLSAQADAEFWKARIGAFAAGSAQYLELQKKIAADEKKMYEEQAAFRHEQLDKARAVAGLNGSEPYLKGQEGLTKWRGSDDHAADIAQDSANETRAHEQRVRDQMLEIELGKEAGRSITQLDALRQEAALHAASYDEELARLALKRSEAEKASYDDAVKRAEALAKIDAQMAQLRGEKAMQGQRDSYAMNPGGSSLGVGFVDALDELTDATRQKAAEMKAFTLTTVNGINAQLEKEMQGKGQKGDWRKLGGQIFGNASGAALKQFEGMGLKALGFGGGKKDGSSAANALFVSVVGGPAGAGGISSPGDINKLFGGAPPMPNVSSTGGAVASSASGFFPMLMHSFHIPGFADGGDMPGNSLVMVGERGPELMRTGPGGGNITSHEDMMSAFGGKGGDTHYHIDARGTDAALVEQRIQHGMAMARAQGSADAQRRIQEHYLRVPR